MVLEQVSALFFVVVHNFNTQSLEALLLGRLVLKGVEIIPGRGKGQANLGTWGLAIMLHFLCGAARGAGPPE